MNHSGNMKWGAKSRKVLVRFPKDLLERTEAVACDLSTDRSKLIQDSVRDFLETRKSAQLARELAEGYRTHAEFDKRVAAEFDSVDSENFQCRDESVLL